MTYLGANMGGDVGAAENAPTSAVPDSILGDARMNANNGVAISNAMTNKIDSLQIVDTLKGYSIINGDTQTKDLGNGKVLVYSSDNPGYGYVTNIVQGDDKSYLSLSVVRINGDDSLTYVQGDVKQGAGPWASHGVGSDTMARYGCVLSSNAIYLNYSHGYNLTPQDSLNNALTTGALDTSRGIYMRSFDNYIRGYDQNLEYQSYTVGETINGRTVTTQDVDQAAASRVYNGEATMARVGTSTRGVHTVVISGMDIDMSSGQVAQYNISDPGWNSNNPIINNHYTGCGNFDLRAISYYR
jgi:hypothetical protein